MSATMTPPATVDEVLDIAAALSAPVAAPAPARTEPHLTSATPDRVGVSSGRLRNALFFAAWTPAIIAAGVVAAVALTVAQPIMVARAIYDERRYR
jgi:hypothetical protein